MKFRTIAQYCLPHHLLSRLFAWSANCRWCWFKNMLINWFIRRYKVDMKEAIYAEPGEYETFNAFFTRALKDEARPICRQDAEMACPVDGFVSQIGELTHGRLIQAKGFDFSLASLLGGQLKEQLVNFEGGAFATLYLSPSSYHRIHMPVSGKLQKMVYVPGRLFSVNSQTVREVPRLFARNERVVTLFETDFGPMILVLVGAMLVAGIETVWGGAVAPCKQRQVACWDYGKAEVVLEKGAEMGRFCFGSTVILLFSGDIIEWESVLQEGHPVSMGQNIAKISQKFTDISV